MGGHNATLMGRNVEIKARVRDIERIQSIAEVLSGGSGESLDQEGVFFQCDKGRIKLRIVNGESQLIFYARADSGGPKCSDYSISPVDDPESLRRTLALAYGEIGCVKKQRMLYLVGQTRVHVDRVANLGEFMELEVVLEDGQSVEEGAAIADKLAEQLGVAKGDLVTGAYRDLLYGSTTCE